MELRRRKLQRLTGKLTIKSYPENPDAWSETLTPTEGYWRLELGDAVEVDRVVKNMGEASIKVHNTVTGAGTFAIGMTFTLYNGMEFDGTHTNAKIRFYHKLEGDNFTGNCDIYLVDVNGKLAVKTFGTLPNSQWEAKEFAIGTATGWDADPLFDWSRIKEISFTFWFDGAGIGSSWIDTLHFTYEIIMPTLRIESSPTGKHFEIDGTSGITPATFQLTPNVAYTVSMSPTDFLYWEDGSTSPTRTLTLAEGENKIITAYYTNGGQPPPPPILPEIPWFPLLVLGGGILGIIMMVYLTK